jgi:dTDP-4-dehydrorhamnose 3,5-epimerase
MRFEATPLPGVMTVVLDAAEDDRGFFARTFCDDEFARAGIAMKPRQMNVSHSASAFTLRGLHYQAGEYAESKLVQCTRGRIFDVAVDLRPNSPAYRRWFGIERSPPLRRMIFIPEGCAHGFISLEPDSDVLYVMGHPFVEGAGRGVRWNDPAFGIAWPTAPRVISPRDAAYPDFRD